MATSLTFKTISARDPDRVDYQAFNDFIAFLRQTYPATFAQLQVVPIADYSLLLAWQGSNEALAPVLFDAHYDVVPIEPGTEADWQHPPFAGVVADGYIWGRGAIDDKLAVISTLEAIEQLLLAGYQPKRDLWFSFVHDEEVGGHRGAANVAAYLTKQNIAFDYIVGEGGLVVEQSPLLPNRPLAMIGLAEKTYLTLTLTTTAVGGHSSNPSNDNAIVRLSRALQALHQQPFDAKIVAPVSDMLVALGNEIGGLQGFMMRNQAFTAPLLAWGMAKDENQAMVRTTTAVTMINAGVKENVLPQQASAKVNFRLLPGTSVEQFIADVKEIINDADVAIDFQRPLPSPAVADVNGDGYHRVRAAIAAVLPNAAIVPSLLMATTDSVHYRALTQNIYRFHPFTVDMQESASIHGTNERIAITALHNAVALSATLIEFSGNE